MPSLLSRYREVVEMHHGWDVPLTCPACGTQAVPVMNGWTPNHAMNFGDRATIYANLECPNCHADLREAAARTLPAMFSSLAIPSANRAALVIFVVGLVGLQLGAWGLAALGIRMGWWGRPALSAMACTTVLLTPMIMLMNFRIHRLHRQCPCGAPAYHFMGLLGRSYCFRCASCGRLMRIRD